MSESTIEAACVKHAVTRGVNAIKLQSGVVGMPDRLFLLPRRRCWLVEFKAPTGRLSPRQKLVHETLAEAGHPVDVVQSLVQFKALLDMCLQATA